MNTAVTRRFPWHVRLALILSLAVLLFSVVTIVRWTGPAVALAYRWQTGDVMRDRASLAMQVGLRPSILEEDVEVVLKMTSVTRVLDVDEAGNATLEIGMESVEVEESSLPGPADAFTQAFSEPHTLVVAPDGRVLESSNPLIGTQGFENQSFTRSPLLPDHPVAPGDTWEKDHFQGLGFGEGGFDIHSENRLLRYDEVNGIETVVVSSDLTGQIDASFRPSDVPQQAVPGTIPSEPIELPGRERMRYTGDMTADFRSWIDPSTGDVLRGEGELSISISIHAFQGVPSFTTQVDMDMETERLP